MVDLAGVGATHHGFAGLLAPHDACPQLRSLDLSDNPRMGTVGAALLLQGLHAPTHLETLRLRNCGLGPDGARAVGAAFAAGALSRLTLLDLEGNGIGPRGMAALARGWSASASAAASAAAAAVPTAAIRALFLGRNALGDRGAQHLGAALCGALSRLETLSLPDNAVGAEGAAALWAGLEAGAARGVRTLDFARNPFGAEGVRGLARCLERGVLLRLAELDLDATDLGPNGLGHVAAALQSAPAPLPLRALGLRNNDVGDAGLARLAAALGALACPALAELWLGGRNALGDGGAAALAGAIELGGLEALRALDVGGGGIGAEGLRCLAMACRTRARGLEALDLSGPVGSDGDGGGGGGVQALGAYWLTAVLAEGAFPYLAALRLGGQGLGRSGLYMLHVALRNGALRGLKTLDLDGSPDVGDAGLGYLAIALRRGGCPRLQELRLAGCGVGDEGLRHLAHALAARPAASQRCFARLGLARNPGLTGAGIASLCDAVAAGALPGLEYLDLDGCRRVGDRGFRALAGALRGGGLGGLVTLRAEAVGLTDEGLAAWVDAVVGRNCSSAALALRELALGRNRLTGAGAAALGPVLGDGHACRRLESLALGATALDDAGAAALGRAVAEGRCPLLREVDVGENGPLTEKGVRALAAALAAAVPLCRLRGSV